MSFSARSSSARSRRLLALAAVSLASILIVAGADAQPVTYGVSVSKGCETPTFVGQKDTCFYVFGNTGATSGDTVKLTSVVDTVQASGGAVVSPNVLPSLELLFTSAAAGAPSCLGGTGAGTVASPYVGATSCLVPFGAVISTNDFPFYTTVAGDFDLAMHKLLDTVNFTWFDLCDVTPTPGTCDSVDANPAAAASATTMKQYTPTITTKLSASTIAVGQSVHDTSQIAFDTTPPVVGGTVTYRLYADSTCSMPSTDPSLSDVVPYSGGIPTDSKAVTFAHAGSYWFQATYSGDAANGVAGPVSSVCSSESLMVNKATPVIATTLSATSIATGGSAYDSARLTGLVNPDGSGTVTYTVYSDSACSAGAQAAGTVHESAAGLVPDSNTLTFPTAGTYFWQAVYSGDPDNAAVTSACTSEQLVVTGPPPPPPASNPAISITKNPKSQSIASGAAANFTIVVTNTGNVTLTNVTVTDPLASDCSKTSAALAALASMAPGASVTYNCTLSNVTASFTNVATVVGTTPSGGTVTANDSAPVTVTVPTPPPPPPVVPAVSHPAIGIVKSPKTQTLVSGIAATFKITVTNTGDVTLTDVTVTDPRSPNCDRSLGTLGVGATKSYTCIRPDVRAAFQNVATVTGRPPSGSTVKATDHAQVDVRAPLAPPANPRIAIVKSPKSQALTTKITSRKTASGATRTTVHYGTAHFAIKVTNTGAVALHAVKVTDPLSPGCTRTIGALAKGASRLYRCVRGAVSSSFTNVATATGLSPTGAKVKASDHAKVTVKVKTASTSGAQFTG